MSYSRTIETLIAELGKLPGIGARTAERLTFHLLKAPDEEALALARAIHDIKTLIHPCKVCFNPTEGDLCSICSDESRDAGVICVVEQPKDLLSIESSGAYNGRYHVLMGAIAPLDGVEAEDLTISQLVDRVQAGGVREVILATNPTVTGDSTSLYISSLLEKFPNVRITRLARGLPAGGQIEYASKTILSDAIKDRKNL
ncbi:MAG TPA: recombination mediator RecR [Phycisphaerae bacterium]|nr:recombination mediator RecR [Phycisphaerae bacterium]